MTISRTTRLFASAILGLGLMAQAAAAQDVPAPGTSARIDAIKKSGQLRVGVLSNPPWLVENTTGSGEVWVGPAWTLAKEYAKRLGVQVQLVPVSHETKVPVLAANQVDGIVQRRRQVNERRAAVGAQLAEAEKQLSTLSPTPRSARRSSTSSPIRRRLSAYSAAPTIRRSPTPSRSTTSTTRTSRSPISPAAVRRTG